jgi:hypothetical protein
MTDHGACTLITPDGLAEAEALWDGLGVPEAESEAGAMKGVFQGLPCPEIPAEMDSPWTWRCLPHNGEAFAY